VTSGPDETNVVPTASHIVFLKEKVDIATKIFVVLDLA
jgi:hypothetical protein